jgi:transcription elongation factor SPT6
MSMRDLISGEAELDDEENDDSFDEETGEVKNERRNGANGDLDDSSEEEDDDDDEEAARAVRHMDHDILLQTEQLTNDPHRSVRDLLWMKKMKNRKSVNEDDEKTKSAVAPRERRKRQCWMRKIWI